MKTFEEWLGDKSTDNMTFKQYGNHLIGWRNSMPWAYKGMSISYDNWAESRWNDCQDKKKLKSAWSKALVLCLISCDKTEDLADSFIGYDIL